MELILMFAAGLVILIIAAIAIIRGLTYRMKSPIDELKEEISILEDRVNDLENQKKT